VKQVKTASPIPDREVELIEMILSLVASLSEKKYTKVQTIIPQKVFS
jgi:hypothetical protein